MHRTSALRRHSVSLHVSLPLVLLLWLRQLLTSHYALLLGDRLQSLQDGRHHPFETAEINVRAGVQSTEKLLPGLGNDVEDGVVYLELVGRGCV